MTYLHHMFFDPISEAERMKFVFFVGLPVLCLVTIMMRLVAAWWENYTRETDE